MASPKIRPEDLLSIEAYEKMRETRRAEVMRLRELRRVEVGPWVSVVFESRETVLYQIQEMVRIERLTQREQLLHEIETYSELLPVPGELSGTFFIEISDEGQRRAALPQLHGVEQAVSLRFDDGSVRARDKRPIDPEFVRPRAACVYYLRFPVPPAHRGSFPKGPVWLEIEHPAYSHAAKLRPEQLAALAKDLK